MEVFGRLGNNSTTSIDQKLIRLYFVLRKVSHKLDCWLETALKEIQTKRNMSLTIVYRCWVVENVYNETTGSIILMCFLEIVVSKISNA